MSDVPSGVRRPDDTYPLDVPPTPGYPAETYPAETWSTPNPSQNHIMAGNDAATSSWLCLDRRIVSTNTWTVMKLWLTTSGRASEISSRLPPGVGAPGVAGLAPASAISSLTS